MATGLKGVILAGGTGSRLHPLTQITNKHLLPIYDRPMISWSIEALVKAGVTDLMLVTGARTPVSSSACSETGTSTASSGSYTPTRRSPAASPRRWAWLSGSAAAARSA